MKRFIEPEVVDRGGAWSGGFIANLYLGCVTNEAQRTELGSTLPDLKVVTGDNE